jgi:beta-xylosidase
MCYADDAFSAKRDTADFQVKFSGLDKEYRIEKYIIDKTHANAYTKFLDLGQPQNPSPEIRQQIRDAGALTAEVCGTVSPGNDTVTVTMTENAVVLLELYPLA